MADFNPSPYQQEVFDFLGRGRGDLLINAVAGSGKTTTLLQAARRLRSRDAAFFAFNRHIVAELGERLRGTGMAAQTLHGYGYGALIRAFGKGRMDERKYRPWADQYVEMTLETDLRQRRGRDKAVQDIIVARQRGLDNLVRYARLTMTNPADRASLDALMDRFDIVTDTEETRDCIVSGVYPLLDQGKASIQAGPQGSCDFTDMIWGPLACGVPTKQFGTTFTDEAQDLNTAQRMLALGSVGPGGRRVFVGDEHQAIMGFAGADVRSYWAIQEATRATVLPLSVCYRCPGNVIRLAQKFVPQIEARAGAPDGDIRIIRDEQLDIFITEGMLILCRMTAPLVRKCIDLIRHKIPARVRGRDVAQGLIDLAKAVSREGDFADFPDLLGEFIGRQCAALEKKEGTEQRIETLRDKEECLFACYVEFHPQTIEDLCKGISDIFSDERSVVWLSTIHRAKGLEAEVVAILKPEIMPMRRVGQKAADFVQELNLCYVAITRALKSLYLVYDDDTKAVPSHWTELFDYLEM